MTRDESRSSRVLAYRLAQDLAKSLDRFRSVEPTVFGEKKAVGSLEAHNVTVFSLQN